MMRILPTVCLYEVFSLLCVVVTTRHNAHRLVGSRFLDSNGLCLGFRRISGDLEGNVKVGNHEAVVEVGVFVIVIIVTVIVMVVIVTVSVIVMVVIVTVTMWTVDIFPVGVSVDLLDGFAFRLG